MGKPKISIIVPVYNAENYIHRCMKSILSQTFTDFECILVDDCSSDSSPALCDDYARQDARVKVIHKEQNGGPSLARETGFENAAGEYIQFVDSDDLIEPDMVERMYSEAASNNCDLVYCHWYRYNGLNQILYEKSPALTNDFVMNIKALNFGWGCVLWNKLARREMYEKVCFPKSSSCEDTYITTQLLFFVKSIGRVDAPLYHYMYSPSSIMNSSKNLRKRHLEEKENFLRILDFIRKNFQGETSRFEPELSKTMNQRLNPKAIMKMKIKKALKLMLPYGIITSREFSKAKSKIAEARGH